MKRPVLPRIGRFAISCCHDGQGSRVLRGNEDRYCPEAQRTMELEYITEEEAPWRPDLCRVWERSVDLASQPDPFCCAPIWQLSAHRAFAPGRRVLAQSTEDSALVLAEAFLSSGQPLLTSLEAHWLFGCPLQGPDAIGLLAEALAVMSHSYGHLPALLLGGIVPGSRRARELYACCESLFTIYLAGECIQGGASLEGGLDGFLSRRSANLRSKWRKSCRRAADRGVTFERSCPTDTAGADAVYARMLAVERRSWKGVGHCGMTESPAREFYADMIRRLAVRGTARVMFARHEDQDIGFIFGGMLGPCYRGQQFSYDAAWKDLSIGNLLQVEQIRWLCEEGAVRYDMGTASGEPMAYKMHWTEAHPTSQTWFLQPR